MASCSTQSSTSFASNVQDPALATITAKILKPLDEVLRCHICFDYFTNCMMTKCNHNYCSLCIRRYMNYKSQCPTCFQVATEPELQNNRLVDEILSIYMKIRETLQISPDSVSASLPEPSSSSQSVVSDSQLKSVKCDVSRHTEVKQQNTNTTRLDEVPCPVCSTEVPNSRINIHLDSCLKQSQERSQRKFLPKLVYHLLSDKEIKKKLKEHGLSTSGNRQTMIRRHKNFITLYNANCDSLNPKPVSDLLLEIERQELEERLNAPQKSIQVHKKSDPSLIEKEHESYVEEHKSQFNALIQDVQERIIGRKHVKDELKFTAETTNITDEAEKVIGECTLKTSNSPDSNPVIIKEEYSESLLEDQRENIRTHNATLDDKDIVSGYSDTSHFSFCFKKEVPEAPTINEDDDSPSLLDNKDTSRLSFSIKKGLSKVKSEHDSPSKLEMKTNKDLSIESSSLEDFESSKMSINKFHKRKYARRLSTEEKCTQRKK